MDLRYTIYCTTVANGKDSDWMFLWNRYRNVQDSPSEKTNLLGALCCSTEIWTLQVRSKVQDEVDLRLGSLIAAL